MIESIRALGETSTKTYSDHLRAIWRDEAPSDGYLEKVALRVFKSKTQEFDLAVVRTRDPVPALGQKMAAELALSSGSKQVQTIVLKSLAGRWKRSKKRTKVESIIDAMEAGADNEFRQFCGIMQAAENPLDVVSALGAIAIAKTHGRVSLTISHQAAVAGAMGRDPAGGYACKLPILRIMAFDAAVWFKDHPDVKNAFKASVRKLYGIGIDFMVASLDYEEARDLIDHVQDNVLLWLVEAQVDVCREIGESFHKTIGHISSGTLWKIRQRPAVDDLIQEASLASKILGT